MPDLPEAAVTAAEDAYRCAHTSGVPRHEIARIVAVAAVEAVMAVVTPLITDLPVVALDDPCVECREPVEPGDRVSWRLRGLPQGLIHEECK